VKKFLRHIALFLLPLLIIAVVLEFVAESIPNSYTYKREYIEQYGAQIQTLILGSSNAYDGLNPNVIPHAFNLANSSQTIEDDYRLLSRYIDAMDSLQTVVLGLGYHSLALTTHANRRMYYTIYMDLYPRWPLSEYSFEVFNLELLLKKITQYTVSRDIMRCDSLGQRVGHTREAVERGTEFWNRDVEGMVDNDKMYVNRQWGTIDANYRLICQMVDMCNARGVTPVIVVLPVMEEYKKRLPVEQVKLYEDLLLSLDSVAVCIDASEWEIPEDGWYNATHLTKEASEAFTRKIVEF
jgi:hypothetical protein